jgi:uncharacterized protein (DUF2132 family)
MANEQPKSKDPLHGITLEMIVTQLVEQHGWEELAKRIPIRCFTNNPSIKSSLTFLRKTPWARKKVEDLYLAAQAGKQNRMSTWYSRRLGDGMTSGGAAAEIEQVFDKLFATAARPADMAVFTRPESEGRLHCEVIAYFSPAAEAIAETFDAEPCEKPARAGLALLAGDETSWSVLFPEE